MNEAEENSATRTREAVLYRRERTLTVTAPHLVQEGLEANSVLVDGTNLNLRLRKRSGNLS